MFFIRNRRQKKREWAIGLDFGASEVRGIIIRRRGSALEIEAYGEQSLSGEVGKPGDELFIGGQIAQLLDGFKVQDRRVFAAISSPSVLVCQTVFPRIPMEEVKSALRLNSARYLRCDCSHYYLDVAELAEPSSEAKNPKAVKIQLFVGGASIDDVLWYRNVLAAAKARPETIELAAVSVVNTFQAMEPEICEKEIVLLVDIGARSTVMNFLRQGMPLFTRVMRFGGQQVTAHISQALTMELASAEEEKIKMTENVQPLVRAAISPLARELRSSIDFFERQHECGVSRAFGCGGSANSGKMLEILGQESGIHIDGWNPLQHLGTAGFHGDAAQLAAKASSLAAVVGVAVAHL